MKKRTTEAFKRALQRQQELEEAAERRSTRHRFLNLSPPIHRQPKTTELDEVVAAPPYFLRHPIDVLLDRLKMEPLKRHERFFGLLAVILAIAPVGLLLGMGFLFGPRDLWFTFAGSLLGIQLAGPYTIWRRTVVQIIRDGINSPHRKVSTHFQYQYLKPLLSGGLSATFPPYRLTNWNRMRLVWGVRRLERVWRRVFTDNSFRGLTSASDGIGTLPNAWPKSFFPKSSWQRSRLGRARNRRKAAKLLRRAGRLLIRSTLLQPIDNRSIEDLPALYMAAYYDLRYFRSPTRQQWKAYLASIDGSDAITRDELINAAHDRLVHSTKPIKQISLIAAGGEQSDDSCSAMPKWWQSLASLSAAESVQTTLHQWENVLPSDMPDFYGIMAKYCFDVVPVSVSLAQYSGPALLYVFDTPGQPHFLIGYPPVRQIPEPLPDMPTTVRDVYLKIHDGLEEPHLFGSFGLMRTAELTDLAAIADRGRLRYRFDTVDELPQPDQLVTLFSRDVTEYIFIDTASEGGRVWTMRRAQNSFLWEIRDERLGRSDVKFWDIADEWMAQQLAEERVPVDHRSMC
jgi:hypothetical protein